eukprot:275324_1
MDLGALCAHFRTRTLLVLMGRITANLRQTQSSIQTVFAPSPNYPTTTQPINLTDHTIGDEHVFIHRTTSYYDTIRLQSSTISVREIRNHSYHQSSTCFQCGTQLLLDNTFWVLTLATQAVANSIYT